MTCTLKPNSPYGEPYRQKPAAVTGSSLQTVQVRKFSRSRPHCEPAGGPSQAKRQASLSRASIAVVGVDDTGTRLHP